jgi:hypothetical protein
MAIKLLKLVGNAKRRIHKSGHHSGGALPAHDEQAAEHLITRTAAALGLAADTDWTLLRKNHREKLIVAAVVKRKTGHEKPMAFRPPASGACCRHVPQPRRTHANFSVLQGTRVHTPV